MAGKKYCSFCKREIPEGEPYRNAFIKLSKENIKMCKDCEDRTIKETIRNYGVRSNTIKSGYSQEGGTQTDIDVWELYRKTPVKYDLRTSSYFRKDNFEQVFKTCRYVGVKLPNFSG